MQLTQRFSVTMFNQLLKCWIVIFDALADKKVGYVFYELITIAIYIRKKK